MLAVPVWHDVRREREAVCAACGGWSDALRQPVSQPVAQPWPACMHIAEEAGTFASKSASSRMRLTDLPPSSRKTGLSVSDAIAMMRRPVAVDPVKATRSTSGDVVITSPTP